MDHLWSGVPSTLSDLFRKESHGCLAVGILCGLFSQQRSRITCLSATRSPTTRTGPSSLFTFTTARGSSAVAQTRTRAHTPADAYERGGHCETTRLDARKSESCSDGSGFSTNEPASRVE